MAKRGYKLQEFAAHASNVNCLNIGKKSNRLLVTGGEDQKVNLWAIGKPSPLLSLSGHTSPVESVTFDSAEVLVVSGASFGAIKLWDLEEAKILRTLTGHRSSCNALQFHPFGEFFASGSSDSSLKIWDVRKKGCIHTYKGHNRGVSTIKFSPDGRWVVSGGADNIVKIWDLTAGKLLHEFKFHEGQIQCIDFHPLEFLLATGSADKTVKFWDLETFEMIGSAGPEATGVRSMAFHPDGKTLFCGLEDSFKVLSWEPIICHDNADMGWSTLGDLTINQGKLLGCSYYHNCVGLWSADISLFSPYASSIPPRSNGHPQQKFESEENYSLQKVGKAIESKSGFQMNKEEETPEIRNIYMDTSGDNKITTKRTGSINSRMAVLPLDSSEFCNPSTLNESPEKQLHMRSSSQVNNRQFTVPLSVSRNTEDVEKPSTLNKSPEKEVHMRSSNQVNNRQFPVPMSVTRNTEDVVKPSILNKSPEKQVHMKSSSLVDNRQFPVPLSVTRNTEDVVKPSTLNKSPEKQVHRRSSSQVNNRQFTVPLIVPQITEDVNPSTLNKSSDKQVHTRSSSQVNNRQFTVPLIVPQSTEDVVNPSTFNKSPEKQVHAGSSSPVHNRQFTVPLIVPQNTEDVVNSRRVITTRETSTNDMVLKTNQSRREFNNKSEKEKLLSTTASQSYSNTLGGSNISTDRNSSSKLKPKVEYTEIVEDRVKDIKSVTEKFDRILSPEPILSTTPDTGSQSRRCSTKISSLKKVDKVQLGRTRSLVERWEKRETSSTGEPLTNTATTELLPESPAPPQILANSEQKEEPQTSGREPASMNDENVLEDLMRNHDIFISSFHSRLAKLQVVKYFWQRNDVKGGLNAVGKLPDHSVQADVVSVLIEKMDSISLELFSCLLPMLLSLLHSQIDRHTNISLEMLLKLVAIFGPVIRSTVSARSSIGVDLQAERRRECCSQCFSQFQKIKQIIPSVIRRGGLLAKFAQELNLLLQE